MGVLGTESAAKENSYNAGQIDHILKGLEKVLMELKSTQTVLEPNVAIDRVQGAIQLIVDASGVIRQLEDQLIEERKQKPFIKITSEENSKSFVDSVIQTLNSIALDGLVPPKYKALCDAVKLIQAFRNFDGVIYVADWKSLAIPKEDLLDMTRNLEKLMLEEAGRESPCAGLLRDVFNTLICQMRDIVAQESSVAELCNLIEQREEELARCRGELQAALQKNETAELLGDVSHHFKSPALLAPEQKGAEQGFWLISREWHDDVVGAHSLDIATINGRLNYLALLRAAVAKLAMEITEGLTLKDFASLGVIVEWDSHIAAEEGGDKGYGPVFCAGTVKLLPKNLEVVEPQPPKEPHFLGESEYPEDGIYAVSPAWVAWYGQIFPNLTNFGLVGDRNNFRNYLATTIKEWLKLLPKSKTPIVIIDWDYSSSNGVLYFVTPGISLTS